MAIIKHIASKNADYGACERYLIYKHDEFTNKPILDENGTIDPEKLRPILYDPVHHLYRNMGDVAGKAFHDGLQLK